VLDILAASTAQALLIIILLVARVPANAAVALGILLTLGYFTWMPAAYRGQTLGKMAAGIAIVRMDGSPLTILRCLGRLAGYGLSGLPLELGFIMAAFTDKKRALHDYICDTRVVRVREISGARKALLIVLALAPLLLTLAAAVALPKILQLAGEAAEETTRGALTSMRAAVAAYSRDNPGQFPADLAVLVPKYTPVVDALKLKDHQETNAIAVYDASVCAGTGVDPSKLKDTGKWGYVTDPAAACRGALFVDCTHTDTRQKQWASY